MNIFCVVTDQTNKSFSFIFGSIKQIRQFLVYLVVLPMTSRILPKCRFLPKISERHFTITDHRI